MTRNARCSRILALGCVVSAIAVASLPAQEVSGPKPLWELNLYQFAIKKPGTPYLYSPAGAWFVAFGKETTLIGFPAYRHAWRRTELMGVYGVLVSSATGRVEQQKVWDCCDSPDFKISATASGDFIVLIEKHDARKATLGLYTPNLQSIKNLLLEPSEAVSFTVSASGKSLVLEEPTNHLFHYHLMDTDNLVEKQTWSGPRVTAISDTAMLQQDGLHGLGNPEALIDQPPTQFFSNGLFFHANGSRIYVTDAEKKAVYATEIALSHRTIDAHVDQISGNGKRFVVSGTAMYNGANLIRRLWWPYQRFVYVYDLSNAKPIFQLETKSTALLDTFLSQDGSMFATYSNGVLQAYNLATPSK